MADEPEEGEVYIREQGGKRSAPRELKVLLESAGEKNRRSIRSLYRVLSTYDFDNDVIASLIKEVYTIEHFQYMNAAYLGAALHHRYIVRAGDPLASFPLDSGKYVPQLTKGNITDESTILVKANLLRYLIAIINNNAPSAVTEEKEITVPDNIAENVTPISIPVEVKEVKETKEGKVATFATFTPPTFTPAFTSPTFKPSFTTPTFTPVTTIPTVGFTPTAIPEPEEDDEEDLFTDVGEDEI